MRTFLLDVSSVCFRAVRKKYFSCYRSHENGTIEIFVSFACGRKNFSVRYDFWQRTRYEVRQTLIFLLAWLTRRASCSNLPTKRKSCRLRRCCLGSRGKSCQGVSSYRCCGKGSGEACGRRAFFCCRTRGDLRAFRAERRGQDDDDPHVDDAHAADFGCNFLRGQAACWK